MKNFNLVLEGVAVTTCDITASTPTIPLPSSAESLAEVPQNSGAAPHSLTNISGEGFDLFWLNVQ
jgi:hypothetical protein